MKLIPRILSRLYLEKESDITISEMREIHQEILDFEIEFIIDQVAETIIYNVDEEFKKTQKEIMTEGLIDGSNEHLGLVRKVNDHVKYFNSRGFIFNDSTYPSAFGKSHYIYRSKGSRILWFENGIIAFSSLYTYLDSRSFRFFYEEIDNINLFASHFENDSLFTDYWVKTESESFGKVAYFIIKNLMNINMNFNRDYPLEHLFISEDVRGLSEYSKRIRNDVMEYVIDLCKKAIYGNDNSFNELKFYTDFLNLVEIDVPSYELIEFIKFVVNQDNNINYEKLNLVINMLNQNSKNNLNYYSHDIDMLIKKIDEIEPGKLQAYEYQNVLQDAFEVIFSNQLFRKRSEVKVNEGRKRIDVIFSNESENGFFYRLKNDYKIFCPNIVIECKNYNDDLANSEVDQLIGRLNRHIGNFGILAARKITDDKLLIQRLKDALRDDKYIIYIVDQDIIKLLELKKDGLDREISDYMNRRLEEIIL